LYYFTAELLGVLSWRDERKQIDRNLDKLMTVQGTEIMKVDKYRQTGLCSNIDQLIIRFHNSTKVASSNSAHGEMYSI